MDARAVADLSRSGITVSDAVAAGMYYVEDASAIHSSLYALPALVMPYFTAEQAPVVFGAGAEFFNFCRVRYLEDLRTSKGFLPNKPVRYAQPAGSGVRAYFSTGSFAWVPIRSDARVDLIITEGEKKALAACVAGFATIGLGGVFNWLADGPHDTRILLPELEEFKWRDRKVYIVFDSDAALNANIQYAEARLVEELTQRGAKVYLVRIPPNGDNKVGLDDYLVANGPQALEKLLDGTEQLGALDAAVIALNAHVCWIERDGAVYDMAGGYFMKTEAFTKGSKYSSSMVRRVVTTGRSPGVKEVRVAAEWLTHPLAQRYAELLFRPGEGSAILTDCGRPALNIFKGWNEVAGDVQPFLDLNDYLMSSTPLVHRELALKVMAYKAQNPQEKIPLAFVFIGDEGTGKTLWTECMQAAFAPYDTSLPSKALKDNFQGWLENTVLAVINEVEPEDLEAGMDRLKSYISDLKKKMNEKFRTARDVNSYTMYMLTANKRAAGAFSHSDRRMAVFGCPSMAERKPEEYYLRIREWKERGGGKALMHYLLNYPLKGWRPPREAPVTPEKSMAYQESLTPIQKLAEDSQSAEQHTIVMWIDKALEWANGMAGSSNPTAARYAKEIIQSYSGIWIRPFYSPEEIAMMFPDIASVMYGNRKIQAMPAGEMSRQLRDCGVPYLECADDPRGFMWKGRRTQFLVLARREEWRVPLPQIEFERYMASCPRYSELSAGGGRLK